MILVIFSGHNEFFRSLRFLICVRKDLNLQKCPQSGNKLVERIRKRIGNKNRLPSIISRNHYAVYGQI